MHSRSIPLDTPALSIMTKVIEYFANAMENRDFANAMDNRDFANAMDNRDFANETSQWRVSLV